MLQIEILRQCTGRRWGRTALMLIISVFTVCLGYTQPYYFRHYQVEDGLAHNTVFCSVQDRHGFLWFGTKDGLNRFDGYRFRTFHFNTGGGTTLSKDQIAALVTDGKGRLWVGSQKGLFLFDERNEQFSTVNDSIDDVSDILADQKDRIWFIAAQNIYCYDPVSNKTDLIPASREFRATSMTSLNGMIWFSSTDGFIHQLDPMNLKYRSFNVFSKSPPSKSNWIEKIFTDDTYVYVGTSSQGIKKFDVAKGFYTDLLVTNPDKTAIYVRDILKVGHDELWIATESGIFILNTETGHFRNLKKKYLDPYSLSDNAVYSLYKDREGGIWVGTYFGGVNYFPKQYSYFKKYYPDYTKNSIGGNAVREICEDQYGNFWISTEDAGINKFEPATEKFTQLRPTGSRESISNSNIHGLLPDGNDLWVGTFEHGIDIIDVRTGKVKKHYNAGPGETDLKSNFVLTFLKTRSGDIYLGSSNSLYRYDRKTDGFITPDEFLPRGIFVSALIEDHKGTIWAATSGTGIYFFNPRTGEKGHIGNNPDDSNSISNNTVNALHEDSRHNIWISTDGGGLCVLSPDRKNIKRYTTGNGLPSNIIFKVLEDNKGTIWASTSKGLVNMSIDGTRFYIYTKANGLLNDQFNYNSGYRDKEGNLYFGSVKGMVSFNPDSFFQTKFMPPVFITGFQVHNKELIINNEDHILEQSLLFTEKIVLPYSHSSFSIDFAAISFASPQMTEYSYFMDGLDKHWTFIKSNRKVYFTNLKPGKYIFKVKAAGNGFYGSHERSLAITILPPFWATPLAYILYFALAMVLIYVLVRTYHNIQENKKEKAIYEAKIEFFTNVAHEIKTPLTLIKGPVENLSEMTERIPEIREDVSMMERNADRLLKLTNQILDFRKVETKGFSLFHARVNLSELLHETYTSFAPPARKKNLSYVVNTPKEEVFVMADLEALTKVFSNLFSNAVNYSQSKVSVELVKPAKNDRYVTIEFRNDGFMIPPDMREKIFEPFYRLKENSRQKGTGVGLALARSLVELHKGKLFVKNSDEGLNIFVVSLPYADDVNRQYEDIGTAAILS